MTGSAKDDATHGGGDARTPSRRPVIRRLLAVDREQLDLRLAALALTGVLVASALEAVIGVGAVQTGVAAVLVVVAGGAWAQPRRLVAMGILTLVGGAFGFVAYLGAESAALAAVVLGVVSYLSGLAAGLGAATGRAGYLVLLWTLAVLIGEAHGDDPGTTAAAFLLGGTAATAVVGLEAAVRAGLARRHGHADGVRGTDGRATSRQGGLIRSDLGVWSGYRAVLTMVAVVVGYRLTSDLDPFWAAVALLIVFQPDLEETLFKAAQRGVGTLLGATTAAILLEATGSEQLVVTATLVAAVGAVACYHANYLIYAFFLTNAVMAYYWLAVDHEMSGPGVRLAATAIGITLALAGAGLLVLRRRRAATV